MPLPTITGLKQELVEYLEKEIVDNQIPDESEVFNITERFITDNYSEGDMSGIIAANWHKVISMERCDMMFGYWLSGARHGIGRETDIERGIYGYLEIILTDHLGKWINEVYDTKMHELEKGYIALDEDPDEKVSAVDIWHWTELTDRAAKWFMRNGQHLAFWDKDKSHSVLNPKNGLYKIDHENIACEHLVGDAVNSVLSGWQDMIKGQSSAGAMDGEWVDRQPHMIHLTIGMEANYNDIGEYVANDLNALLENAISRVLTVKTIDRIYELLGEGYLNDKTYQLMAKNEAGKMGTYEVVGNYDYIPKEK